MDEASIEKVESKGKLPGDVCMVDPSWTSKLVWDIYVMSAPEKRPFNHRFGFQITS